MTWILLLCLAALILIPRRSHAYEALRGPTGVIRYNSAKSYGGYTVLSPTVDCLQTWLLDMRGDVVHTWTHQDPPGLYAQILPNGNLLRAACTPQQVVHIGGAGGKVQEFTWAGDLVWEYVMSSETEIQHHSFHRMPNGNTLILGWERKTKEEALAKGRKPGSYCDVVLIKGQPVSDFWPDFIREVTPKGEVAWEWHAWDHLGTGPDQLDINYTLPNLVGPGYADFDWSHFNCVDYLPGTDQVLINSRNFGEIYLIDHKTGHISWRFGNPTAYGKGRKPTWFDSGDMFLSGSHHASALPNGNIQVFDNGSERPETNRSRVVEVNPATNEVVWQYQSWGCNSFFSHRQGGAQRLPNGNVLVTSTQHGHLFEVNPEGEVVWEFVNPIMADKGPCHYFCDNEHRIVQSREMFLNMVHRAYRYGADYPGLQGKDLSVKSELLPGYPKFFELWN